MRFQNLFKLSVLVSVILMGVIAPVDAADKFWNAPTDNFFDALNAWTGNVVPAVNGSDRALFHVNGTYDVQFDATTESFYGGPPRVSDLSVFMNGAFSLVTAATPRRSLLVDGTGPGGNQDLIAVLGVLNIGRSGNSNEAFRLFVDGDARIQSGAVNVWQGSQLEVGDFVDIAVTNGHTGTLLVSGTGANLHAPGGIGSYWGRNGGMANVTFENSATSTVGSVELANSSTAGTTGHVVVRGGATLASHSWQLAAAGGMTTSATFDVYGASSSVTQNPNANLTVGHATTGIAVINIGVTASGGSFTTGSTNSITAINRTGTVTISGVTNSGTFTASNGLTINGGALQKNAGGIFTLGAGKTLTINNGGRATFAGGYTTATNAIYNVSGELSKIESPSGRLQVDNGATVNISGGALMFASSFIDMSLNGNGTLNVDGEGSLATGSGLSWWATGGFTANVTLSNSATGIFGSIEMPRSTVAGTTANVSVLSGANMTSGTLRIATDGGTGNLGTLSVQGGGSAYTLAGAGSITLGHASAGTGTINVGTTASGATFTTGTGTMTIARNGRLNVGGAATTGTFNLQGNASVLGEITVNAGSSLHVAAGRTLTLNSGGLLSNSGMLKGNGTVTGNVQNGGGVLPGTSVGTLSIDGDYTHVSGSTLRMEIGSATSFDRLLVSGHATLTGQIFIQLVSGFTPTAGDTFDLIDWGSVSGAFNVFQYPGLPGGLDWDFSQISTMGIVKVVGPDLAGDYNSNGTVDAADYVLWRDLNGQTGSGLAADGNGDNVVNAADYNLWRANFGQTAGSGAGVSSDSSLATVPESGTLVLLAVAIAGFFFCRR